MDAKTKSSRQEWLGLKDRALSVAAEGITIADALQPGRPLIYVNEGFERLTGYSAAEALGRNCRFLQGEVADPETVAHIRHALIDERDCTVEIHNVRKDGTPFWNRLSITPVRDAGGRVTHFIGIQSDVSQRRLAEEALRDTNAKLQEANATLQRELFELPRSSGHGCRRRCPRRPATVLPIRSHLARNSAATVSRSSAWDRTTSVCTSWASVVTASPPR